MDDHSSLNHQTTTQQAATESSRNISQQQSASGVGQQQQAPQQQLKKEVIEYPQIQDASTFTNPIDLKEQIAKMEHFMETSCIPTFRLRPDFLQTYTECKKREATLQEDFKKGVLETVGINGYDKEDAMHVINQLENSQIPLNDKKPYLKHVAANIESHRRMREQQEIEREKSRKRERELLDEIENLKSPKIVSSNSFFEQQHSKPRPQQHLISHSSAYEMEEDYHHRQPSYSQIMKKEEEAKQDYVNLIETTPSSGKVSYMPLKMTNDWKSCYVDGGPIHRDIVDNFFLPLMGETEKLVQGNKWTQSIKSENPQQNRYAY